MIKEISEQLKNETISQEKLVFVIEKALKNVGNFIDMDEEDQSLVLQGQLKDNGIENFQVGDLIYKKFFKEMSKSDVALLNKNATNFAYSVTAGIN